VVALLDTGAFDRLDPAAVLSRVMYDLEAIRIVERGVDARRFAWSTRFQDEIGRVENDLASRGLGHSGALLKAVADVCVKEIETRATDIWEDLYRALIATGVRPSSELSTELKRFFNELFRIYTDEPQRRFDGACDRMGGIDATLRMAMGFDGRVYGARARIESQIDLFARSLEQGSRMNKVGGDTIFQIYAPVGVIQTGAGAKANLVQNFDAARKEFTDLLGQIESQLAEATMLEATQVAELRDAINETREEMEKSRPSRPMLFAKLQVIASLISTAIQSAPVLRSGYEALRSVLATYGIALP
jgi:hypothetical protein